MTRKEEIKQAAEEHALTYKVWTDAKYARLGFICGAQYADEHPLFDNVFPVAKPELIDKACEWLKKNIDVYVRCYDEYPSCVCSTTDKLFDDFRKYMEE